MHSLQQALLKILMHSKRGDKVRKKKVYLQGQTVACVTALLSFGSDTRSIEN